MGFVPRKRDVRLGPSMNDVDEMCGHTQVNMMEIMDTWLINIFGIEKALNNVS
jgi:hypothetical protein